MTKRELVGHCGVDSGLIFIGDPCYIKNNPQLYCIGQTILAEKDKNNSHFPWISYSKSAIGISLPDRWKETVSEIHNDIPLPKEMFDGVMTNTRNGDGSFPVYATFDNEGRVKKLEIVF